ETVIKEVNDVIMHQTTEIKKIDIDENFGTWDKFIQWLSYITFRSIFKLFTFYFSKKTMTE
ncbi:MAG: hypothetical protein RLY46_890, partial [Bacteroidota bacterium]